MGNMMAYRTSMFLIFFNYAMSLAIYIGTIIFPDGSPELSTYSGEVLRGVEIFSKFGSVSTLPDLLLTAGVLALFAFSLLIPTIPFMFMFFALNGIISAYYINQMIPACSEASGGIASSCVAGTSVSIFSVPLTMGLAIVYYIGISQYAARSSLQGS